MDEVGGVFVRSGLHCVNQWFEPRGICKEVYALLHTHTIPKKKPSALSILSLKLLKDWSGGSDGRRFCCEICHACCTDGGPQGFRRFQRGKIISGLVSFALFSSFSALGIVCNEFSFPRGSDDIRPSNSLNDMKNSSNFQVSTMSPPVELGVDVCIVDTGIDMTHPDLKHIQLAGWRILSKAVLNPMMKDLGQYGWDFGGQEFATRQLHLKSTCISQRPSQVVEVELIRSSLLQSIGAPIMESISFH